jgi:5-methylcytosine-specific restriction endonuclease McrA
MTFELRTLEEYTDGALLAELRRVAEAMNGQRLTLERFNSLSRVHSTTLRYRFGSWQAALDKAGISEEIAPRYRVLSREKVIQSLRDFSAENPGVSITRDAFAKRLGVDATNLIRRFGKWENLLSEVGIKPVPLGRRYTDEECFENILVLWTHYGRQPHFGELKHPPSTVDPKAYTLRWGGWRAALSAFVKQVNEPSESPSEISSRETNPNIQNDVMPNTPAPRSIPLALRYKILSRDNFRCVTCGASPARDVSVELHIDHIYPWSRGGQNVEDNLRTLCFKCNLGKGDKIENAQPGSQERSGSANLHSAIS